MIRHFLNNTSRVLADGLAFLFGCAGLATLVYVLSELVR